MIAIKSAQPSLNFLPPTFNPWVLKLCHWLLPYWLKNKSKIDRIEAIEVDKLLDLYQQFQNNQARFVLAFRHPSIDDPFVLLYLLGKILPETARKQKRNLKYPLHAHFIYDRGIPIWAGNIVSWLYPKLGCTPICRGKLDRAGLKSARELFFQGQFPLAAAPEGATNGHSELISPLEPGITQMAFWCKEDLVKSNQEKDVFIVPIGINYGYLQEDWQALAAFLTELEISCGDRHKPQFTELKSIDWYSREGQRILYQRLYKVGIVLLNKMFDFYRNFYHLNHLELVGDDISNSELKEKLQLLLNASLQVSEEYFNLTPKGSIIDRCRRIEQAAWDCIFREDIRNPEQLSPLEKGLADRIAAEADLRMWHMRLVESFVAVTGAYVLEKPSFDRFAETTLLLWNTIGKITGKNPLDRVFLGERWARITIGEPININDRWANYTSDRRQAKQTISDVTQQLQTALENIIVSDPLIH